MCARRKLGCEQPPVRRHVIDEAIWRFVTETALDLEATRALVADQHRANVAEAAALREQAQRDQATAEARLTRVRRDYQDGRLDAEDWRDQRDELTAELEAAQAKLERLTAGRAPWPVR